MFRRWMDATGASALAMGVALLGCSDDGIANQSGGGVTGNGSGLTADGDDAGDDGGDTGTAATSGGSTGGAAEASTGSSGSDGGSTGATGDTGSTDTGSTDTGSTDTGSTDTGSTGTGSTDTGGSDSGGSSDSGGNMCPPANGIGIGSDCAGGGVCPDCLTCQPFVGFVLQETCQILCAGPADCPPGYNCVMAVDKTGVPWQQCEP